ncbi:bifunctional nuclease family protein [Nodosilinea sp. LEGE 06152]|uniref:bifunctional nuclease family protein n=1 Tax=Nodosilinea sp. LEGE 06152 TaxID=2777966 RepID=UPI001881D719|nr:bifunctional nuclease family protein [Nodosilinea sp. LEGE 06152]MBE9156544.1 bifunctional nuclease family protein [Nodosilinea sp. LEGE 06152]
MIEMRVAGIALDAMSRTPVILLRDTTDRRQVPIYISREQANSIIAVLENQPAPRPLTHDLFVNLLDEWDMTLDRVVIHSLQDNTYYALLTLSRGEIRRELDSRPSDAIAIALRLDAPIWVMEEVIAEASIPVDRDADEAEKQAFQAFLANINPSDFSHRGKSSTSNDTLESSDS